MEGMGRIAQSAKVDRCLKSCTKPIRALISNRSSLRRGHMFASQVQHLSRSIRLRPGIGLRCFELNSLQLDRPMLFVDDSPDSLEPQRSMKLVTTIRTSLDGLAGLIIHIGPISFDARRRRQLDSGFGMTGRSPSS